MYATKSYEEGSDLISYHWRINGDSYLLNMCFSWFLVWIGQKYIHRVVYFNSYTDNFYRYWQKSQFSLRGNYQKLLCLFRFLHMCCNIWKEKSENKHLPWQMCPSFFLFLWIVFWLNHEKKSKHYKIRFKWRILHFQKELQNSIWSLIDPWCNDNRESKSLDNIVYQI